MNPPGYCRLPGLSARRPPSGCRPRLTTTRWCVRGDPETAAIRVSPPVATRPVQRSGRGSGPETIPKRCVTRPPSAAKGPPDVLDRGRGRPFPVGAIGGWAYAVGRTQRPSLCWARAPPSRADAPAQARRPDHDSQEQVRPVNRVRPPRWGETSADPNGTAILTVARPAQHEFRRLTRSLPVLSGESRFPVLGFGSSYDPGPLHRAAGRARISYHHSRCGISPPVPPRAVPSRNQPRRPTCKSPSRARHGPLHEDTQILIQEKAVPLLHFFGAD